MKPTVKLIVHRHTPGGYVSKLEVPIKLKARPKWESHIRSTPRHNEWARWFPEWQEVTP